jgi:hypothetical protein
MPRAASSTGQAQVQPDDYKDKLIKYVPAEVLAFYAPLAAALAEKPERKSLLITVAIAGLVATPGYLWYAAKDKNPAERPLKHFYLLAALSFVAWAICTSALGATIGLDQLQGSVVLGITVLLLPLIDALLAKAGI